MKNRVSSLPTVRETGAQWIRVADVSGQPHVCEKNGLVATAIAELGALLIDEEIYPSVQKKTSKES
jgi:hypothetical protein